jgi:hypothetical protein
MVALSGAIAYGWCVLRFVRLTHLVGVLPFTGFALTLCLFGLGALFLLLQPVQYMWLGIAPRFRWVPPSFSVYALPHVASISLAIALLPATMLAGYAGWSARKSIAAVLVTLAVILLIEGWIAPAARHAARQEFFARAPRAARFYDPRDNANMLRTIALVRHEDQRVANNARQRLRQQLQLIAMAVSFATLGAVMGRLRVRARAEARLRAVVVWWLFAWVAYQALQYWGQFLLMMWGLPGDLRPWFAPTVFVLLSVAAMLAASAMRPRPTTSVTSLG